MASHQPPPPPPESPAPPTPTTVIDLGDDLLREIFHRLPSLPSLVRAALSCRTFLDAVRSSPAFRRHFSASRPPHLLGFFFDPDGPAIPSFAPIRRRSDPDLAAAVRGADFFLTRLPDEDDASPGWVVCDCRDGYVLLRTGCPGRFAAYNPLTRALDLIPPTPEEIFDDSHGYSMYLDRCILPSKEGDGTFRVVSTCHDESRARAAVFSSESREWQIFPWSEPVTPHPEDKYWLTTGTMVNGFVYWIHKSDAYMLVLNTTTLQFSQMDLPSFLEGQDYLCRVGEAKDGKLCLVCPIDFDLYVWFWRADDDGIEKWMLDKRFALESFVEAIGSSVEHVELHIMDTIGGFVYFSTGETFNVADSPSWFLCLCMETVQVDKLFQKPLDSHVRPYIMPWPSSLVDNKPAFEEAYAQLHADYQVEMQQYRRRQAEWSAYQEAVNEVVFCSMETGGRLQRPERPTEELGIVPEYPSREQFRATYSGTPGTGGSGNAPFGRASPSPGSSPMVIPVHTGFGAPGASAEPRESSASSRGASTEP